MNRKESSALDRHITGNYGEDQFPPDITQIYLTDAGNCISIAKQEGEHVWMQRLGYFDSEGEYHPVEPQSWANFSEERFNEMVGPVLKPAVMMMGGIPILEDDYISGSEWKYER